MVKVFRNDGFGIRNEFAIFPKCVRNVKKQKPLYFKTFVSELVVCLQRIK